MRRYKILQSSFQSLIRHSDKDSEIHSKPEAALELNTPTGRDVATYGDLNVPCHREVKKVQLKEKGTVCRPIAPVLFGVILASDLWMARPASSAPQTPPDFGNAIRPSNPSPPMGMGTVPAPQPTYIRGPFKPAYPADPEREFWDCVEGLKSSDASRLTAARNQVSYFAQRRLVPRLFEVEIPPLTDGLVGKIREALESDDPFIQCWGIINLEDRRVPPDRWAEMLLPVLERRRPEPDSSDFEWRNYSRYLAVYLVGYSRDPDRRSRVVTSLDHILNETAESEKVRVAAAQSLLEIEAHPAPSESKSVDGPKGNFRVEAGSEAVYGRALDYLLRQSKAGDADIRSRAITTLGLLRAISVEIAKAIGDALMDKDKKLRAAAIQSLVDANPHLTDPKVIGAVIAGLTEFIRFGRSKDQGILAQDEIFSNSLVASGLLARISDGLRNRGDTSTLAELRDASAAIAEVLADYKKSHPLADDRFHHTNTLYDALTDNKSLIDANRAILAKQLLYEQFVGSPEFRAGLAAFLLIASALALVYARPLTLLEIRQVCRESLFARLFEKVARIKVDDVTMPRAFGAIVYHPRVLDAWLARHLETGRREFRKIPTVERRKTFISCPAKLDGKVVPELTPESIRRTFEGGKGCLLITGEGGAGKTSLACLIAGWSMSTEPARRLARHPMLPILIERDLETSAGVDTALEAIRQSLRTLIGPNAMPDDELLVQLLNRGRLLVIVDHLSEMSETTRALVRPARADFPAAALVVTSRDPEELDGVSRTVLKPVRLSKDRLGSFVEAYLNAGGHRDLFDDAAFHDVCLGLARLVGDRDVTALLAILYADQAVSAKAGEGPGLLPGNIPDLFLNYLRALASHTRLDRDEAARVESDMKAIAWESLKETYRPSPVGRNDAIRAIKDADFERRRRDAKDRMTGIERRKGGAPEAEPDIRPIRDEEAEARLLHLEEHLRIVEDVQPGGGKVKVSLDPLAEYLAGMAVVEKNGKEERAWRRFVDRLDDLGPTAPAHVRGFLLAVRDCSRARQLEWDLPASVLDSLEAVVPGPPVGSPFAEQRRPDLGHSAPRRLTSKSAGGVAPLDDASASALEGGSTVPGRPPT